MNWGYKIILVYLVFITGIGYLVVRSVNEKTDLVVSDYYEQELKYQQKIDESKRVTALSAEPEVKIEGQQLTVHFPPEFKQKKIDGNLLLYYPADKSRDIRREFSTEACELLMVLPGLNKGQHTLQLQWNADGSSYYFEKKIFM